MIVIKFFRCLNCDYIMSGPRETCPMCGGGSLIEQNEYIGNNNDDKKM